MFKAVEAFIFCLVFTGGGNFLSIYYEIGQPGMWFLLGVLILAPFTVVSGKKIIFSSILFMLLISSVGYLLSFFLDISNSTGLSIYLMPLIGFMYLLFVSLQSESRLLDIKIYTKISLVILCFSIIAEPYFLYNKFGAFYEGVRLSGLAMNPNLAAFYIIVHLIVINMLEGKIPRRLMLLSFLCVVVTFSRSGILAMMVVFILVNVRNFTIKNMSYIALLSVFATGVGVILFSKFGFNKDYFELVTNFNFDRINPFNQRDQLQIDSSRINIINDYMEEINNSPIFGHGPVEGSLKRIRAHNTIINIWFEIGIFGALSFVGFLVSIIVTGFKRTSALMVAWVCLFFTFFINNLLYQAPFWLMVGILLSRRVPKKENSG